MQNASNYALVTLLQYVTITMLGVTNIRCYRATCTLTVATWPAEFS